MPPHSKDTLDVGAKPLAAACFTLDSNRNTFANQNRTTSLCPPPHFRRGGGEVGEGGGTNAQGQPLQEHNSNLPAPAVHSGCSRGVRGRSDSTSHSDEEMGSAEDSSPASSPAPLPLPPTVLDTLASDQSADQGLHSPRVNMATVAPFSYRQVAFSGPFSAHSHPSLRPFRGFSHFPCIYQIPWEWTTSSLCLLCWVAYDQCDAHISTECRSTKVIFHWTN